MQRDANVAAALCEQLVRIRAYVSALNSQPALPALPPNSQPANTKVERQQRYLLSTKKKARKHAADVALKKLNEEEKRVLLDSLAGDLEVVSRATDRDHDYDATPGQHIAFEHSYI